MEEFIVTKFNLPKLKIGKLVAKLPIVQGGMAYKVSTAPLAAAVANEGGIGLIGASGLSVKEIKEEIRRARKLSSGIIGVNIMVAVSKFKDLVKGAVDEGIDLIVAGAGFSRDLFSIGKENDVEIVPVVSSLRVAKLAEKMGASAVVVEGKEAGGHLGTDRSLREILEEIIGKIDIPVIAAGGIMDGKDIAKMIKLGVDGVQMGSRFVASEECEVEEEFKELYINAGSEDGRLIESPVGLEGRVLNNKFIDRLAKGETTEVTGEEMNEFLDKLEGGEEVTTGDRCNYLCLKKCSREFCIMEALRKAKQGNMEEGLVFAGERAHEVDKILPTKKIIKNLVAEAKKHLGGEENNE